METEKVERHSKEVAIKMMFMLFPFFPFKYATLCSFLHIRSSTQYIQFILFIHIYLKLIIGSPYSFLPLFMYQ